jgi:hypothetical protein
MGVEEHLKQSAELILGIIGFAFKVQHCYELVVRTVKIMDQPGTRLDVTAKRFNRPLA